MWLVGRQVESSEESARPLRRLAVYRLTSARYSPSPVGIALVINPLARQNRRDPSSVHRLVQAMGSAGELHRPKQNELAPLGQKLAENTPEVIAIHGGDGTLHKVLCAVIPAFVARGKRLPPIALLAGGTMNVVAHSLGLASDPYRFTAALAQRFLQQQTVPTTERRCLEISSGGARQYGFIFANGMFATFLEAYYATGSYGGKRAAWVTLRAVSSGAFGGTYAKETLRPYVGGFSRDGAESARKSYSAITASTVTQVGMGFRLHHRADEDPDRFSLIAVTASPVALMRDVRQIRYGHGIDPTRAETQTAAHVGLLPTDEMVYTVDGDLYRTTEPLQISPGPRLSFVKPLRPIGH